VTIYFTYYVIPIVLLALPVYWLLLRRDGARIWFLAAVSMAVLAAIHPAFAVIAVGLTFLTHQLVALWHDKRLRGTRLLAISIALALLTLVIGKYGQDMAGAFLSLGKGDWVWTHLARPLGISYFVFRLLQYVFDQLRGVLKENRFRDLLAFLFFIPTFPAGPIETFQGFYGKRSTAFDKELFERGLRRIVVGYFKKVFVVDFVFATYLVPHVESVKSPAYHVGSGPALLPLAFVVITFVRAYIDLSAYTDLAIGFSRLFGFRIMENFANPLFKKNLGDFWRSWHISLSSWCRNNVYFPVFGLTRKVWLGLFASMLVMGLWHEVDLNWTVWALYHGSGLVFVNWWMKRKKRFRKQHKGSSFWSKKSLRHTLMTPIWYALTFYYVALGFAFVGTFMLPHGFEKGLRIFVGAVIGPLVWLKHLVM
jgi:alginate O-acetyltransferase complex protein AlgI